MITKSDFLIYFDAPRHLWAVKHQKLDEVAPSPYTQHLMAQGQEVEKWADQYLQEVILPTYQDGTVERQRKFVEGDFEVITDGLIYDPHEKVYDLYEIKSATSVKKENYYDAAFQALVCETSIPIRKIFIVHLNKEFIRQGEIDFEKLFIAEDVSEEVDNLREEVKVLRQKVLHDISLDSFESVEDCLKPNECPCKSLCHPSLPADPINNIPRLHWKKKRQLKDDGILSIKDIPDGFKLSEKQQLHVDVIKGGVPHLDASAVQEEQSKLIYPLYFLDYETFNPGIPMFDGYHPYQQIVFQFSLHIQKSAASELEHHECLITGNEDPAGELLEQLAEVIGETGSVIVWNKGFEAGRNKEMAALYPSFADILASVNERMFDLAVIFQKGYYIHPDFFGSYSIKNVLPVLAPEISYKELAIPEGTAAMLAWAKIVQSEMSGDEVEQTREDLLKYCELDTFAMLRILQETRKIIGK